MTYITGREFKKRGGQLRRDPVYIVDRGHSVRSGFPEYFLGAFIVYQVLEGMKNEFYSPF